MLTNVYSKPHTNTEKFKHNAILKKIDGRHQGNKSQLKLINSNETGEAKLHVNKNIKTPNSE